ncbi:MAG: DNA polymerase III subunit delta [Acidobacteriota bacterium]|nr:DNA polymerase III subunit delta [Acidobacteriota bacterium]
MSNKVYREAAREILDGKIPPVYLVIGDEQWSRGKFLDLIKKNLIDPDMADFNFDHLQATDVSGVHATDKAGQLPMMADRRLVVVEDCEKWKAKDQNAITKYLENPNEQACLVLLFNSADKRRKLFQSRSKAVRVLTFERPKPWELNDTIRDLARDMKLKLDDNAVALVADLAGDDLAKVSRELDKLSLYKLGSNEITAEDVEALMGRTRHVTRWELTDFIGTRNLPGALVKMHAILASGEDAIGLLSTVNMHLRRLFAVKAIMMKGIKDRNRIAQVIGVPPRIAGNLTEQQRTYSDVELRRAFVLMRETDVRLKSAAINKNLLLDHLLTQILSRGPYSPPAPRASRRR